MLNVIHTSDWHLGQTFKGFDRCSEHAVFLSWLLDTLVYREVDALLISGDIFDQSNPSADAQKLFYSFLAEAKSKCPQLHIIVIAGNHDSPGRMDAPHPVLSAFNITVIGQYSDRNGVEATILDRVLVPIKNSHDKVIAWVLAVPFLRPGDMSRTTDGLYQSAVRSTYLRLVESVSNRREADQALILMGHLHIQGAEVSSDSERRLIIGGEEALDSSIFPQEATYVALGHLHKPQAVGSKHIRYSGSPLPLSFSEINYSHQVLLVQIKGAELHSVEPLPIPRPAKLLRVPSTPMPIETVISELTNLNVPICPCGLEPLIEVQLLASIVPTDLRARVDAALAGKKVRLTGIQRYRPERTQDDGSGEASPSPRLDLRDLKPEPLFDRLLAEYPDLKDVLDIKEAFAELLDVAQQESR